MYFLCAYVPFLYRVVSFWLIYVFFFSFLLYFLFDTSIILYLKHYFIHLLLLFLFIFFLFVYVFFFSFCLLFIIFVISFVQTNTICLPARQAPGDAAGDTDRAPSRPVRPARPEGTNIHRYMNKQIIYIYIYIYTHNTY